MFFRTPAVLMSEKNDPDSHVAEVQGLFIKHQPAVRGFILSMIPDFSLADDLVQETFLVVTKKAHTFEMGTSFLAWVGSIARYKVLETLRQHSRRNCFLSEEVLEALWSRSISRPTRTSACNISPPAFPNWRRRLARRSSCAIVGTVARPKSPG